MSARRRRPGCRGALFLLLLGVAFLGVGVLLHLYGSDDRAVVAQDLGAVPGSAPSGSAPSGSAPSGSVLSGSQLAGSAPSGSQPAGSAPSASAAAARPLAEKIPVLSGLDELLGPDQEDPSTGVAGVTGGFDAPAGATDRQRADRERADRERADRGGGAPGSRDRPAVAPPGSPDRPAVAPPGSRDRSAVAPPGPAAAGPGTEPAARAQAADENAMLADPVRTPAPRRPAPVALPPPPAPLAPAQPGLLGPVYPLPEPAPARPAPTPVLPVSMELPARGITAPVDPVGTDPSGGMVVPEQVRTVGWWAPGVLPGGASGSAVIAGHVDSRTQGIGVLSVLPQLTEGEPVLLRDASGRTAAFRVAARREYAKFDLPREVFRRDGAPQLVLITCGGRFDPAARSYESNIVVYAVPAAS